MNPLSIDFRSERYPRWLKLYNARFVDWILRPVAFGLLVVSELLLLDLPPIVLSVLLALSIFVVAWNHCRWRLRIAKFWVDFHMAVFTHGESLPEGSDRRDWYGDVQHWLERCSLAGPEVNRLAWRRERLAEIRPDLRGRRTSGGRAAPSVLFAIQR